ncbi:MAG: hypothetical protein AAGL96_18205 [Pseudomonadota bacterium]
MTTAAVTMVWNDDFFLEVWRDYYAPRIGLENLYVLNHGSSASVRRLCEGANVIDLPRDPQDMDFDVKRWTLLSGLVNGLTGYFDTVLCGDVDELVVPTDPALSLEDMLDALPATANYCAAGFELFPSETPAATLLAGCAGALFSTFYSKSCILRKSVNFFPGAHGLMGEAPGIAPDAVMFHLKLLNSAENARRNRERLDFAQAAFDASGQDRDDWLAQGKPLATWLSANNRSRKEARKFRDTPELPWNEALASARTQLENLRVQNGDIHRFRRHPRTELRAALPSWMHALI